MVGEERTSREVAGVAEIEEFEQTDMHMMKRFASVDCCIAACAHELRENCSKLFAFRFI